MTSAAEESAVRALRSSVARMLLSADLGVPGTRRITEWIAVRTAVESNDVDGVVSAPDAGIPPSVPSDLAEWLQVAAGK